MTLIYRPFLCHIIKQHDTLLFISCFSVTDISTQYENSSASIDVGAMLRAALQVIRDQSVELGSLKETVIELNSALQQIVNTSHLHPLKQQQQQPTGSFEPLTIFKTAVLVFTDKLLHAFRIVYL